VNYFNQAVFDYTGYSKPEIIEKVSVNCSPRRLGGRKHEEMG
jgi:hypothetical protein